MEKKSDDSTCVLTLPLIIEKWQADKIDRRLEAGRQMYNALVGVMLKRYRKLQHTPEYQEIMQGIKENKDFKKKREKLLEEWGFIKFAKTGLPSFESEIDPMRKHFTCIQSHVGHRIAASVCKAFKTLLDGKGKKVHFKQRGEFNSLEGKNNTTNIRYANGVVKFNGLQLKVKLDRKNIYESEMLQKRLKYCRVLRQRVRGKNKYYVQLILEGTAAVKRKKLDGSFSHVIGSGRVGLDIGTQTLAICSDKKVALIELADRVGNIEAEKRRLQRKIDRSRRSCNPENFAEDGQIRRGIKLEWNLSNHYKKAVDELRELQRKQAAIRKYQHYLLVNEIISLGTEVYVEDMDFAALQRRAKKTEKNTKGRFKRKKRFGKSLANKAPSMLLTMLDNRLKAITGHAHYKVDKWEFKASQYDHLSKTYNKKSLSKRIHCLENGDVLQRDLYSAFLIMNASEDLKSPDSERCECTYTNFKVMHDNYIEMLAKSNIHTLSSMGINQITSGANVQ